MNIVEVDLLGRFEVRVDGRSVPPSAWSHRRAHDLVKLLALAPGHVAGSVRHGARKALHRHAEIVHVRPTPTSSSSRVGRRS